MLRGSRYETTAIPEIRAQAAALAARLVEAVTVRPGQAHSEPDSSDREERPPTGAGVMIGSGAEALRENR
jgi:hypothetical protein